MGCVPSGPRFLFTILPLAGTCAVVDALDEVPIAMDAVLVVVSPHRTCSRSATEYVVQCSSPFSTSRRV